MNIPKDLNSSSISCEDRERVSFVVACYHSEKSLPGVVEDIFRALPKDRFEVELILVDDGSSDGTFRVIREIASDNRGVKGVRLARNFGQQHAMLAGFRECSGSIVVYCDDDGQSPVKDIAKLIGPILGGEEYDMVWAAYHTPNGSLLKRLGSYGNELMARWLLKKPKDLVFGNLWACRRFVIDEVIKCDNPFPYLGGMFLRVTNRMGNVYLNRGRSDYEETTYSFRKLLSVWLNGFTAYSLIPLRLASVAGFVFALCGFLYMGYTVVYKLLHPEVQMGYSSLMSVMLFMFGIVLGILGIMGEYIGRIYLNINKFPQSVIRETVESEE